MEFSSRLYLTSTLPWLKFLSDTLILLTLFLPSVVFSSFFIHTRIKFISDTVLIYGNDFLIHRTETVRNFYSSSKSTKCLNLCRWWSSKFICCSLHLCPIIIAGQRECKQISCIKIIVPAEFDIFQSNLHGHTWDFHELCQKMCSKTKKTSQKYICRLKSHNFLHFHIYISCLGLCKFYISRNTCLRWTSGAKCSWSCCSKRNEERQSEKSFGLRYQQRALILRTQS